MDLYFKYLPTNYTAYCSTNIYIAIRVIVDLEALVFCLITVFAWQQLPHNSPESGLSSARWW